MLPHPSRRGKCTHCPTAEEDEKVPEESPRPNRLSGKSQHQVMSTEFTNIDGESQGNGSLHHTTTTTSASQTLQSNGAGGRMETGSLGPSRCIRITGPHCQRCWFHYCGWDSAISTCLKMPGVPNAKPGLRSTELNQTNAAKIRGHNTHA